MIKIIEHESAVETRVMGFDKQPYSGNACGAPDDMADAARSGFGFFLPDFDVRTFEWRDSSV